MKEIFGDYVDLQDVYEYLVISFDSTKLSQRDRWKGNSISADFLAAYWGSFVPVANPNLAHTQIKDTISWTANELIENAVKFSDLENFYPIKIFLNLSMETLDFYAVNSVSESIKSTLKAWIDKFQTCDATQMYFEQIENNAEGEDGASGLGMLTMKMDLGAEIAWKFEELESPRHPGQMVETVTTFVRLPIHKSCD